MLERELRIADSPGYRDFLSGREMGSEGVNVCPDLLSTIPGERKYFTSEEDFRSMG